MPETTDPYAVLGVSKIAAPDDIRKAFRKLAKKYHPDLNPGDKAAEARFKEIGQANDLLSDAEKRRRFDAGEIDAQGQEVPPRGFYRDEAGNIFHTYSCFARGLDMMNAAYHYLDLTPLGRHEEGLPYPLFALSGLVAKMLYTVKMADGRSLGATLYAPLRDSGLAPVNASLLHALAFVAVMYAVAWVMYRKQWFVKV